MKSAFALTCACSLVFWVAYGALIGQALSGPYLGIITTISALLGAAGALSARMTKAQTGEVVAFGIELRDQAGTFAKAAALLRTRPFLYFWLSLALYVLGFFLLAWGAFWAAGLVLLAQIVWFVGRAGIYAVLESGRVPRGLEGALEWILRSQAILAVLATLCLVPSLTGAEIVDKNPAILLAVLIALAGIALWYRIKAEPLDSVFPIKAMVAAGWAAVALLVVNRGVELRSPVVSSAITFKECPSFKNQFFNNAGEKMPASPPDHVRECARFAEVEAPGPEAKIEVVDHLGAFGITWRERVFSR